MLSAKKSYSLEEAKKILEKYCVYQERCHQEVRYKLKEMHMIPEVIDVVIVHLLNHNFLNELRFAKTFVSGKFKIKKWGKHRLINELKKREISKINISEAIGNINQQDYLNTLHTLAIKKFENINEINVYKKRKKLADYLLYRGWESHLVYEKVSVLIPAP